VENSNEIKGIINTVELISATIFPKALEGWKTDT
jgi:hypothetical protein